jgi:hypothetical protein
MNNEDRKYLTATENVGPNLEIFAKMAQILKNEYEEIDKLWKTTDVCLLETYKTLNA